MKAFVAGLLVLVTAACTPTYTERSGNFNLPKELQDCQVFSLRESTGNLYTVFRCPNSDTTVRYGGKHKKTISVIEGEQYENTFN
jgi:hypothetical protein